MFRPGGGSQLDLRLGRRAAQLTQRAACPSAVIIRCLTKLR
jgi:hypothetical protein